MNRRIILGIVLSLFLMPLIAQAHPGATDASGGHYDYSTGEYHYHHGYPEHDHDGGHCPYDYDDRTGENSGTPGNGSSNYWYTTAPRPVVTARPTTPPKAKPKLSFVREHPILIGALCVGAIIAVYIYVSDKKEKERERLRKEQRERERQEAVSFYSSHDLRTLVSIPDIYYVDGKNVPYEYNKPNGYTYGETLDVYISYSHSVVYHKKGCPRASYSFPKNVYSDNRAYDLRTRRPCSVCNPPPFPDLEWYSKYLVHMRTCEEFDIKPKLNPIGFVPPSVPKTPDPPPVEACDVVHVQAEAKPTPIIIPASRATPVSAAPQFNTTPTQPVENPVSKPVALPEPSEKDIPNVLAIYRSSYPQTWRYIQNHAADPVNYVYYYHYVWGKLQESHGDGIIYGHLTEEQQALINYPFMSDTVYVSSSSSDKYHSTPFCYSLLRSNPVHMAASNALGLKRCSKCVPPQ